MVVVDYLEHDVEAALRSEAAIVGAVGLIGLFGTAESLDYFFYCHISKTKNRSLAVTGRHDAAFAVRQLHVQIAHVERVLLNKLTAALDVFAHQRGEDNVRGHQVLQLDP